MIDGKGAVRFPTKKPAQAVPLRGSISVQPAGPKSSCPWAWRLRRLGEIPGSRRRSRVAFAELAHEAGVSVADLCRKHGVSDASIYKWKAKFGGMDVSEAKRLRALEDENAKLKRMLADAMLDNVALKDLLGKKW